MLLCNALLSLIISYPSFTLKVSRSHAARRGKVANPRLGIGPQEAAPTCCSFLRSRSGSQWALECRILTGMAFQDVDRHAIVRLNTPLIEPKASGRDWLGAFCASHGYDVKGGEEVGK